MRSDATRVTCGARRLRSGVVGLIPILCLPLMLAGCGSSHHEPTVEKFVETREVRGMWVTITLITGNGKRAVAASDAAFACLDSLTAPAGGKPDRADGSTEGNALAAAAGKMTLLAPGARADLDDLAQGHAVDCAIAALRREGVADGAVQLGEKLRCSGAIPSALADREAVLPVRTLRSRPVKPRANSGTAGDREARFEGLRRSEGASPADPRPWRIDLPDPLAASPLGRIGVGDRAVAIYGPAGGPTGVAVIAATALEASGLAQALAALGPQRGLALAESLPGVEALIVTGGAGSRSPLATSGFPALEPVP